MDREEALKEQNEIADSYLLKEGSDLINKIYNDFESRTCESCKLWEKETKYYGKCNYKFMNCTDYDFGCNKWEPKND